QAGGPRPPREPLGHSPYQVEPRVAAAKPGPQKPAPGVVGVRPGLLAVTPRPASEIHADPGRCRGVLPARGIGVDPHRAAIPADPYPPLTKPEWQQKSQLERQESPQLADPRGRHTPRRPNRHR